MNPATYKCCLWCAFKKDCTHKVEWQKCQIYEHELVINKKVKQMIDKFRPLTDEEKQHNEVTIKRTKQEIKVRQNYVEILKEEIKNGSWFNDNIKEA
jgi:hypothetical protein